MIYFYDGRQTSRTYAFLQLIKAATAQGMDGEEANAIWQRAHNKEDDSDAEDARDMLSSITTEVEIVPIWSDALTG